MTRVVVVQPYIPQYRVPFFERLTEVLADGGVELVVAAGRPEGDQAARGDGVDMPGLVRLPERRVGLAGRSVVVRSVRSLIRGADLVILEQARRNVEAYPLLFGRSAVPVALWGHGRTSTRATRSWEDGWLDRMTMRADWFFAYTEGGRTYLVDRGFPSDRVTVIQNSTDTRQLRLDVASVVPEQQRRLREQLSLTAGRTALYLGALDESKRIGFLLAAAGELAQMLPGFTLVVCGDGPWRRTVETIARTEPWLVYHGPVHADAKARIASLCDVLLNPGRVGLAVVDSFALGLPMVTTAWPGHAPEFEYLDDGVNGRVTPDAVGAFAAESYALLCDQHALARLRDGCAEAADHYSIQEMAERFAGGLVACLQRGAAVRTRVG